MATVSGPHRVVDERSAGQADGSSQNANRLTIEELAARSGMTVRNIRAHQARGLLPAPEIRQRVGYYGQEHLARLELIQELQAEGFNLKGIKRLLERTQGSSRDLLGLTRAVTEPFETEEPQAFTAAELLERLGPEADPEALRKAEQLGLVVEIGPDRFEAPTPSLLDAAEQVVRRGVPLRDALGVLEEVQRRCDSISRAFVDLFLDHVWRPVAEGEASEERWSDVREAIEDLRPLATRVTAAVFGQRMTRAVEEAFGKELRRRSGI
jgi:DNA-binding transcriptional MerR regulator